LDLFLQLRFTGPENPAGVPQNERPCAASTNRGNAIARNSGLIMNNRYFSADQTIKERRFTNIWSTNNCDARQIR
jgi:hypothetical protein